jgi:hypothetical protein
MEDAFSLLGQALMLSQLAGQGNRMLMDLDGIRVWQLQIRKPREIQ